MCCSKEIKKKKKKNNLARKFVNYDVIQAMDHSITAMKELNLESNCEFVKGGGRKCMAECVFRASRKEVTTRLILFIKNAKLRVTWRR